MIRVQLAAGREKLALNRHPWVYSGAIDRVAGKPQAGEIVEVVSANDQFLAYGQFNSTSKIRLRLMEWDARETIDSQWYERRVREAWQLRLPLLRETNALRVFFSESDGIPGLVADLYDRYLVVQFLTSGAHFAREAILEAWKKTIPDLIGIVEKSDGDGRRMEGLPDVYAWLDGREPEGEVTIRENGISFRVDLGAQKTGYYTDQRDNRKAVAAYCENKRVLDAFCYTGSFSAYAMYSGAKEVTLLDSSAQALELAQKNLALGSWKATEIVEGDAFEKLRELKKLGRTYDVVILDPPKLASSREHVEKAMRGYKDLNLQALKLLERGGYLASFSCSGLVDLAAFREMIAFAAKDSGRKVDIVKHLHQSPCHPIRTSMPEAEYLKGVLCRVL